MKVYIVESFGRWMEDEDAPMIEDVFDSLEKALYYIEKHKEDRTEVDHKKHFNIMTFDVK